MLKIAMVTQECSRRGGIERVVAELAERFARDGHEVHVFTSNWSDAGNEHILFHKVGSIPIPGLGLTSRLLNFFVFSRLAMRGQRFDVTHGHIYSWRSFDVVTCHGTHAAWAESMLRPREQRKASFGLATAIVYRIMTPLLNYNYRSGRHVRLIAISESIKRELVELCGAPPENVVVVPNGVDLEEFHPRHRETFRPVIRQRYGLTEEDFVFLFVGNFFKRKGLGCLLQALASLKDQRGKLLVLGRDEANLPLFQSQACDLGIADRVIFVGGSGVVTQYYAASDAFVFPSLYEPFGLVILEAMAAGLPVIAPSLVGVADLLTDGRDALLFEDPHDPECVGDRMRRIMESVELCESLSRNGRLCAEQYSWEETARKTMAVYQDVITLRKGGKPRAEERLGNRRD